MAEISAAAVKGLREQTGAGMMDCKKALAEAGGDLARAVELLREKGLAKAGKREGRATSEGVIAIACRGGAGAMVEVGCETDFVARTDDFGRLAQQLAETVLADPACVDLDALLASRSGGESVADRINAAIAKLGENVVVKRVASLEVDPGLVGGYVHAGGKLGVLVALSGSGSGLETLVKDVAMHIAAADPSPIAVDRSDVPSDLLDSERKIYRAQAEQEGKPAAVIDRIVEGKLNKFLSDVCLLDQAFVKDPDRSIRELLGAGVGVSAFCRFKLGEASEA